MEKKYLTGLHVIFVDEYGKPHDSLATIFHGADEEGRFVMKWEDEGVLKEKPYPTPPCMNLLYVSSDPLKTDIYGRQIERRSSVVHKVNQQVNAMYWCWPEEL